MAQVLRHLTPAIDPRLLVGHGSSDDAAVYLVRDDLALVVTADFFAPIVDDARTYGEIAANNALSDVFAMGAEPLLCLNLVGWPRDVLSFDLLGEVLAGGEAVATAAGALVVGGHSVDDREPKYGMAVVGTAHPDDIRTNAGMRVGDELILTKPLGTGLVTTALKADRVGASTVAEAVEVMRRSNGPAMRAARAQATALTDVTGFGLLGHARELAAASGVSIEIDLAAILCIAGARALAEQGLVPGGTRRNLEASRDGVRWDAGSPIDQLLLADAQTAGGLLIAVPHGAASATLQAVRAAGDATATRIGVAVEAIGGIDLVVR